MASVPPPNKAETYASLCSERIFSEHTACMLNRGVMGWQQQAGRALVHGLCSQWDTNKWGILWAPFASSSILFLSGWQSGSPWRALLIQLGLYMVPCPPFLYYLYSSGEHYTYVCECIGVLYTDPVLTGQMEDQAFALFLKLKQLWLHSVDLSDFTWLPKENKRGQATQSTPLKM